MDAAKRRMIEHHLRDRGITSAALLRAFGLVERERFVPDGLHERAYDDNPLPIGHGQTISQPYIVAYMLQELELRQEHRALEVGAGSGYVVALLSHLCGKVVGTERIEELAALATENLSHLKRSNYRIVHTPATLGSPADGPFDRIIVSATAASIPGGLFLQLAEGGVMVIPVGSSWDQWLWKVTKTKGTAVTKRLLPVRFVPLF